MIPMLKNGSREPVEKESMRTKCVVFAHDICSLVVDYCKKMPHSNGYAVAAITMQLTSRLRAIRASHVDVGHLAIP